MLPGEEAGAGEGVVAERERDAGLGGAPEGPREHSVRSVDCGTVAGGGAQWWRKGREHGSREADGEQHARDAVRARRDCVEREAVRPQCRCAHAMKCLPTWGRYKCMFHVVVAVFVVVE